MEPIAVETVDINEGNCPHRGDCRVGSTLFRFYKDGELKVQVCVYKKMKWIDVSGYDKMEAFVKGYPSAATFKGNKVCLYQSYVKSKYTFDLSDKTTIDLYNDMGYTRDLDLGERYIEAYSGMTPSSEEGEESSASDNEMS